MDAYSTNTLPDEGHALTMVRGTQGVNDAVLRL
jgi:hypothetical protein